MNPRLVEKLSNYDSIVRRRGEGERGGGGEGAGVNKMSVSIWARHRCSLTSEGGEHNSQYEVQHFRPLERSFQIRIAPRGRISL